MMNAWRNRDLRTLVGTLSNYALVSGLVMIVACSSTPERKISSWQQTLDFSAMMIAQGKHAPAKSALSSLSYREGELRDRVRGHLLLGEAEIGLENWSAALDNYYRARSLSRKPDAEFVHQTALGLGLANQGLGRWTSADRDLQEALASAKEFRHRDRLRVLLARGALARSLPVAARDWLKGVKDPATFHFAEMAKKAGLESSKDGLGRGLKPKSQKTITAAHAPTLAPRIFPREDWKASPLRQAGKPTRMARPYRMTIHHGGDGKPAPTKRVAASAVMRAYQQEHFQRDWADIAYHFVIDGAGRVWEGRSMDWQGAHAGNEELNRGNIGICCMGTFEKVEPSQAQKRSLVQLVRYLSTRYQIRWDHVVGHDEILSQVPGRGTACPGAKLAAYLDELRHELRQF